MSRYSEAVMDHFQSPRNWGRLDRPDHVGVAGVPGQGRYLVLHLRLEGDVVTEARFQSHGCGATIACGSVLTELIVGRDVDAARGVTASTLLEALGGLPPDKGHCAEFAAAALRQALEGAP